MTSCDRSHDITFQLPHPDTGRRLTITLRPWSQGLTPLHIKEYLESAGADVREHFHHLWALRLSDLAQQVDPVSWHLWRADIPDDIYTAVLRHGLDNLATLYLLCTFPELKNALVNGPFLASIVQAWMDQVRDGDYDYAMVVVHRKLTLKRHVAIGYFTEDDIFPVSPLRIKLMGYLPGSFDFRDREATALYRRPYDPLLPHFFSCRRRFKEKLYALNAFYMAARYSGIPVEWTAPLFSKVIRQPHKLRLSHLKMLFIRLKGCLHVLGIPSLKGILHGAGSLRVLEKHVRRLERRLNALRSDGGLPDALPDFPTIPVAHVPFIQPILTIRELRKESSYMINCIDSYEDSIRTGSHAAFRMCWPERATILLAESDGDWIIEDARAFNNADLTPSTMDILTGWLQEDALPSLPESLPEFFPHAMEHQDGEWRYSMEIDDWEYLAEGFDRGDGDFYDPCWLDAGGADTEYAPSTSRPLPETINDWSRATNIEHLAKVGFDADMLSSEQLKILGNPGKYVYVHPGLTLGYVIIHDPAEPHHSLEVVKHHFARWKGMTTQGRQLVESLRQRLDPFKDWSDS